MAKKKTKKVVKKTTTELFTGIVRAINSKKYYFSDHGEMRSATRQKVTDFEVIRILRNSDKWHEKAKDKYVDGKADWNYHIRGKNTDEDNIRIAVSFDKYGMVVITVINLDEGE